jgi:fatty acid desaturase
MKDQLRQDHRMFKLRYTADRRTLGFVGFYFSLLIFQWVAVPTNPWVAVPLFIATCIWSWFCAIITHNTIHCPIFKNKKMNSWFQIILSLTYGNPVSSYVSGHNLSHHRFTQKPKDIMRTTKVRFSWNFLNLLFFFPAVIPAIVSNDFHFSKLMKNRRPRWYKQFIKESAVFYAVSGSLLLLDWRKFLIYWFVPHIWAAWGIVSINFLQHDGCDEDSEFNHSRNFVGKAFGWFTFNNGFHTIHHIKPGLHWSLLREIHDRDVVPYMHPALNQASILKYTFQAFILPGHRIRYDGEPLVIPNSEKDQDWFPKLGESINPGDLGAEGV